MTAPRPLTNRTSLAAALVAASFVANALCPDSAIAAGGHPNVTVIADETTAADTWLKYAVTEALRRKEDARIIQLPRDTKKAADAARQIEAAAAASAQARANFESLDLEAAQRDYGRALAKLERAGFALTSLTPMTDALAMLSAVQLLLSNERKARNTIDRLLVLDPSYVPDTAIYNPDMMKFFKKAAAKHKRGKRSAVSIVTVPPGAAILVDGKFIGVGPIENFKLRRGSHFLQAEAPGFDGESRRIDVKRSQQSFKVTLPATPAPSSALELSRRAIARALDPIMSDAALELLDISGADELILVAAGSPHKLVRLSAMGTRRVLHRTNSEVTDQASAAIAADILLGYVESNEGPFPDPFSDAAMGLSSGGGADIPGKTAILAGLYGVSLVLAAGGGFLGYSARQAEAEFERNHFSENQRIDHSRTTDQIEGKKVAARGKRNALLADSMFTVSALSLASGLLVQFLWDGSSTPAHQRAGPEHPDPHVPIDEDGEDGGEPPSGESPAPEQPFGDDGWD